MKAKLNNKMYDLVYSDGNGMTLTLCLMNVASVDEVVENARLTKEVYIYDDDEKVTHVYSGYQILKDVKKEISNQYVSVIYQSEYDDKKSLEIITGSRPSTFEAETYRTDIEALANFADDETASKNKWAYPQWKVNVEYKVGDKCVYDDTLYKCLQAHISQETWNPVDAPSLWAKVINEDPAGDIPVWEQPTSTNPYMKGDKVWYPAKDTTKYQSLVDNNVWSPIDYPQGWEVIE